jgi:DNA-binding NtrC family response regulator
MPTVRIYLKNEFRWIFTLLDKEVSIGRSLENHIVLPHPDVSRHHAAIRKEGKRFVVEDRSGKGLQVNQLTLPQATLRNGDTLRISTYRLIFDTAESSEEDELPTETISTEPTLDLPSLNEKRGQFEGKYHLRVTSGPDEGKTVHLEGGTVKIGRNSRNTLALSDPSVSSFHLEIEPMVSGFQVRDLGSTNGTLINGQKIQSSIVKPGAEIQVGKSLLMLLVETTEKSTPPSLPALRRLIGESPKMIEVYKMIQKGARGDVAVLIQGETGCGKELVAQELHRLSPRAQGPFVTVDCSAIPKDLIESELFGHEKGAFTTALAQRKGAFDLARGGTVFLDEIGELPLELQPKLLRVLEEHTFKRVGGNDILRSDFRVVAATNRWLDQEVVQGRFRQDLFFRLYVLPILLPPLRERKEDIPLLVEHFLKGKPVRIAPSAMDKLMAHDWPGNVRELRNTIERAVVILEGDTLQPEDILFLAKPLPDAPSMPWEERNEPLPSGSLEEIERRVIQRTLKAHQGDKKAAAQVLGIALSTLYEKLKRHQIGEE